MIINWYSLTPSALQIQSKRKPRVKNLNGQYFICNLESLLCLLLYWLSYLSQKIVHLIISIFFDSFPVREYKIVYLKTSKSSKIGSTLLLKQVGGALWAQWKLIIGSLCLSKYIVHIGPLSPINLDHAYSRIGITALSLLDVVK